MKKKQNDIVKSNVLVEARYSLTLQEQRLVLYVVSKIRPGDPDFQMYSFRVSELIDALGIKNRQIYSQMQDLTKALVTRELILIDEEGVLNQTTWFSLARYEKGKVSLRFDPFLKPYLLDLRDKFLKYQFENVLQLQSFNSIRLYELCKQYQKIGHRTFAVEDLRWILALDEKYPEYKSFKKYVIVKAIDEINKYTDIEIKLEEIKSGRSVEKVKFYIKSKKSTAKIDKQKSSSPEKRQKSPLFISLTDNFLLSRSQAEKVLAKYDEEYINEVLTYVEDKYRKGGINNLGSYTYQSLINDYRPKSSLLDSEIDAENKIKAEERQKRIDLMDDPDYVELDNKLKQKYFNRSISPNEYRDELMKCYQRLKAGESLDTILNG